MLDLVLDNGDHKEINGEVFNGKGEARILKMLAVLIVTSCKTFCGVSSDSLYVVLSRVGEESASGEPAIQVWLLLLWFLNWTLERNLSSI